MSKLTENMPALQLGFPVSLGEGNTPLVPSQRIGPRLGLKHLYFKLENLNPTGSYKDRFASVAASLMLKAGMKKMLATSSGNNGSALAAYAARYGLELELYVLENAPDEKLSQAVAFGAKVIRVKQFGISNQVTDDVFRRLQKKALKDNAVLLVSAVCFCPREMAGVESIAYEIWDQLKQVPDHIFIPVGGGGLFVSCYHAFKKLLAKSKTQKIPQFHAVQPEGCATVVGPLLRGETLAEAVECTSDVSGLQVASVLDGQQVVEGTLLSNGSGRMVSDEEIYHWQARLIREEGIYAEPAGAVALAGLAKAEEAGVILPTSCVVCLVTGSGFKDRKSIEQMLGPKSLPLIEAGEIRIVPLD